MIHANRNAGGFTLVETLVAMVLVSAVLLPASFWLYRSRTSEAAWDRFRAVQILEMKINRAWIQRQEQDGSEEIPGSQHLRLEIHVVKDGAETRLMGTVRDRKGKPVTSLDAAYFHGKIP